MTEEVKVSFAPSSDPVADNGTAPAQTPAVDFGIPGVTARPGDHICALYRREKERDEILIPFLEAGLRDGEKCVCIIDSTPLPNVLASFGERFDVDGCIASHQLDLLPASEAYLRSGRFSTDEMLGYWDDSFGAILTDGRFTFVRATGEMPWTLRDLPEREDFFRYESELNRLIPRYPTVILCLYDLNHFGGGIVMDLLKTHPKLLIGGRIVENPYCLTPDEFLAARALEDKARSSP